MMIRQSTLYSLLVAVGFAVVAIDTAERGPDAMQIIVVDNHDYSTADPKTFKPIIDLIQEYAPQSKVEVLERTRSGDTAAGMYILVRYPNLAHLEDANARILASSAYGDALKSFELTGRTVETIDILLDRTPY